MQSFLTQMDININIFISKAFVLVQYKLLFIKPRYQLSTFRKE